MPLEIILLIVYVVGVFVVQNVTFNQLSFPRPEAPDYILSAAVGIFWPGLIMVVIWLSLLYFLGKVSEWLWNKLFNRHD